MNTQTRFILADSLFYLSWMIPVPVYMLFLIETLPRQGQEITVYCLGLVASMWVHTTLGHLADKLKSGLSAYSIAAGVTALYGLIFVIAAVAVEPGNRLWLYAGGEALSTFGLLFYWGAFPKWFRASLEAEQTEPKPPEFFDKQFRKLITCRLMASLLGNVIGLGLWIFKMRPELIRLRDVLPNTKLNPAISSDYFQWNPFTWSALVAIAALAFGRLILGRARKVATGSDDTSRSVLPTDSGTSLIPYPDGHQWPTGRMAWTFITKNPSVAGVIACAAALRVTLTTLIVFMPIYLNWVFPSYLKSSNPGTVFVFMCLFWVAVRIGQVFGNRISAINGPGSLSFFLRALSLCFFLGLLGLACIGLSPSFVASFQSHFLTWVLAGIVTCFILFVLYGTLEPTVMDWITALAPPPIRGAVGAYASTIGSVFEVISLILLQWISIGFSHAGQRSFPLLFTGASLVVLTLFLFALPLVMRFKNGRLALPAPNP